MNKSILKFQKISRFGESIEVKRERFSEHGNIKSVFAASNNKDEDDEQQEEIKSFKASSIAEDKCGKNLTSSNSHASPASEQFKGTTSQMDGQGLGVSSEVSIKKMPVSDHRNLNGSNSSCILFSENVNIKVPTVAPDISQRIEMLKVSAARTLKVQKVNELGCEGDNISCISKADGTNLQISGHNADTEQKNVTGSSTSVTSFCQEGTEKSIDVRSIKHASMRSECIAEEGNKFRGSPEFAREAIQSVADISDRSDPSETSSLRDEHGAVSPKIESASLAIDPNLLTSQKGSHARTYLWKGDADIDSNGTSAAVNKSDQEQHSEMRMTHSMQEPPLQYRAIGDNEGSDELVDVRVCDICGDVGREALLAVCSKCSDGAEHIYCMRIKMDKVPEGDWMCEDCVVMAEAQKQKDEERKIGRAWQNSSTNEMAKTSRKFDHIGDNGSFRTGHASLASPRKRHALHIEVPPSAKRRALDNDTKLRSPSGSFAKTISPRPINLKTVTKGDVASPSGQNSLKDALRKAHEILPGRSLKIDSQFSKGSLIKQKSSNSIDLRTERASEYVHREQKTPKGSATFGAERHGLTKLMKSKSFTTSSIARIDRNDSKKYMDNDFKIPKVGSKRSITQRSYSFNSKSSQSASLDVNSSISIVKSAKVTPAPVEVKQRVVQKDSHHVAKAVDRKDLERANNTIRRVAKRQCDTNGSGFDRKIPGSPAAKCRSPGTFGRTSAVCPGQKADRKIANAENEHKLKNTKHQVNDIDKVQLNSSPSGATVVLDSSAHPEADCVWRGMFNLECNKLPICCSGLQAHLSTLASPKALEVVSKFPCEITVKEVLQQDIWPVQFMENRVTEDNIALYFFAEDYESNRRYKRFLNCMMLNDLALMANLGGVELLIFHSQALARSQRWNNLCFLWGVFRAKRSSFPDNDSVSSPREAIQVSIPNIVISPQNPPNILARTKSEPVISNSSAQVGQGSSAIEPVSGSVPGSGSSSQREPQTSVSAKSKFVEGISIDKVNDKTMKSAADEKERTFVEVLAKIDNEVDGKTVKSDTVEKEQNSGGLQPKIVNEVEGKAMESDVEKEQTSGKLQAKIDNEVEGTAIESDVEKEQTSGELQGKLDNEVEGTAMESDLDEKEQISKEVQAKLDNEVEGTAMESDLDEKEQICKEVQAKLDNEVEGTSMESDLVEKEQASRKLQATDDSEFDEKMIGTALVEKEQTSGEQQDAIDNEAVDKTTESAYIKKEQHYVELQSTNEVQKVKTSPDQDPEMKLVESSPPVLCTEISAQPTTGIENISGASFLVAGEKHPIAIEKSLPPVLCTEISAQPTVGIENISVASLLVAGEKHPIAIDVNVPVDIDELDGFNGMNGNTISLNSSPSISGNTGTTEKAMDHHHHHHHHRHSFNLELPLLLSENELANGEDMHMVFGQLNGNADHRNIEDDGFLSLDLSLALPSTDPNLVPMMEDPLPDMNDDVDTSLSLSLGGKRA